jgi:hypothetical protein
MVTRKVTLDDEEDNNDEHDPNSLCFMAPYREMESMLVSRGVSPALFRLKSFYYEDAILDIKVRDGDYIRRRLNPKRQMKVFQNTIENPTRGTWTYCITGKTHPRHAQAAALHLAEAAMERASGGRTPLWWRVVGGKYDKLRDDDMFRQSKGVPSLLVIDGLNAQSTWEKIEKVTDLLEMYANVPRIVTGAGTDPITFMSEVVHLPVNRVLYFGSGLLGM